MHIKQKLCWWSTIVLLSLCAASGANVAHQCRAPTSSGYLSVRPGAELFHVFYESEIGPDTPIVLWLQGGPGCSSMLGAFFEGGPNRVDPTTKRLVPNRGRWSTSFGLLFIDSPVGTGFSYARDDSVLCTNQDCITRDVYQALVQWFAAQPSSYSSRPLILSGESYAGKHLPSLAHYITFNLSDDAPFSMRGVACGNGYTDPPTQFAVLHEPCRSLGVIGELETTKVSSMIAQGLQFIGEGQWAKAREIRLALISFLEKSGGLGTLYDLRRYTPYETADVGEYLNDPSVKASLHAYANITFQECSDKVAQALAADNMKSAKWAVDDILKNGSLPVLLFQGQHDGRDGVVSTAAWLETLTWPDLAAFLGTPSALWHSTVQNEGAARDAGTAVVAGTVRTYGPLSQVVVRNCGHMCAHDQSTFIRDLLLQWMASNGIIVPL